MATKQLESPGPPEGIWKDRIRRPGIAASKLAWHLWCEAVDVGDPDWPPSWLYRAGAVIAFIVVVYFGSSAITDLLTNASSSARSSNWGLIIDVPIRAYFERHSAGLPVSPQKLIHVWGWAGLILFIVSCFGSRGARVGWVIFGLCSCAAVYAGTQPPAQWTAAGIAAFAWSGLSILAFNSIDRRRVHKVRRKARKASEADQHYEEVRKNAHRHAKRQGYKDLEDYFSERGSQPIPIIATELKIPKTRVKQLRGEYLEDYISVPNRLTPQQQREIRADIRSGKYTDSAICNKYGCSPSVVKRVRASLGATSSEYKTVGGDSSSSQSSSQAPNPSE